MDYKDIEKYIIKVLSSVPFCVLATANKRGEICADQMCLINDGLKVYIQTDETFEKVKNIKENPNVALNVGAYYFRGLAKIVGRPNENSKFIEKIKERHLSTYNEYTNLPSEVLVEIDLNECKIWGSAGVEKNAITKVNLKTKEIDVIKCDSMAN